MFRMRIHLMKSRFVQDNASYKSGGVPKRSTGSDCKSDGSAFAGSNPAPSTNFTVHLQNQMQVVVNYLIATPPLFDEVDREKACEHRIMAITSAFQADDVGSIPTARSNKC